MHLFIPGYMPELLGKTFTFNDDLFNTNSRISTKQEPGSFVLRIAQTRLSDMGFYFCLKSQNVNVSFLNATFLRIKGPEPHDTAVTQDSLSETIHKGGSVGLQCSVLSQSENNSCPEERKIFWFRVSSAQSVSLIYAQHEVDGECKHNPETQSGQSCVFNFVKHNISFSDAGTYLCALAACGRVVFGNGTKVEIEGDSIMNNTLFLLLSVTVGLMLIVAALLVCWIRKKHCKFCKGMSGDSWVNKVTFPQTNEDTLEYSTAVFTQRKANQVSRVKARRKEETIYSEVRAFDKN
uniref:Ig-like domain-containing protein n=1 Tax=Fundulus heteroclitus TaxID=8078 RepID=A0A3Q2PA36_FUNHE